MSLSYLKDAIPFNQPTTATIKKILPPKPKLDYKTQQPTGAQQYPYVLEVNGTEVFHYAHPNEQSQLEGVSEGTEVRVIQQQVGKARVMTFNVLNAPSNGHANGQEKRESNSKVDIDKVVKDVRISLQGWAQSIIAGGVTKDIDEALDLAEEAMRKTWHRASAIVRSRSPNGKR